VAAFRSGTPRRDRPTLDTAAPIDRYRNRNTTTLPHYAPTDALPPVDETSTLHNV